MCNLRLELTTLKPMYIRRLGMYFFAFLLFPLASCKSQTKLANPLVSVGAHQLQFYIKYGTGILIFY